MKACSRPAAACVAIVCSSAAALSGSSCSRASRCSEAAAASTCARAPLADAASCPLELACSCAVPQADVHANSRHLWQSSTASRCGLALKVQWMDAESHSEVRERKVGSWAATPGAMCTRRTTSAPPQQRAGRRPLPGAGSWAPQFPPQAAPRAAASGTQLALSPAQPHPRVEQMLHLRPHYRTPSRNDLLRCFSCSCPATQKHTPQHALLCGVNEPFHGVCQWQQATAVREKRHTTSRQASLYCCTPSSAGTLPSTSETGYIAT